MLPGLMGAKTKTIVGILSLSVVINMDDQDAQALYLRDE